jgi:hypothetical protein
MQPTSPKKISPSAIHPMNQCVICHAPAKKKLCKNPECKKERARQIMAIVLKKYGGQISKFRKTNGMSRPEVRKLVSEKLRAMHWKPVSRGGNGKPPPHPQGMLAEALRWDMEIAIPTSQPRGSGYPTHYKIDIGNPEMQVAIEVDGNSHGATIRKAQDKKKDAFLRLLGWLVLRFSNKEVIGNLNSCVQKVWSTTSKFRTETRTGPTEF